MNIFNLVFAFFITLIITGCAANTVSLCSAPAGVAAPVDDIHTVFGIALGQPVTVPECRRERNYFDGYSLDEKNCYKRPANFRDCSVISSGHATIELRVSELPIWIKSPSIGVRVINGNIETIKIKTRGIDYQEDIFAALTKKYGKPSYTQKANVKNKLGASFESMNATWKVGDVSIMFLGVAGLIDEGHIEISTKIGEAASDADDARSNRNVKPL